MKRVKCPQCGQHVVFDETQCGQGQKIVLHCSVCGKDFGIRLNAPKQAPADRPEKAKDVLPPAEQQTAAEDYGYIVVIENVFHYKQTLPLCLGENKIGRYAKSNPINTPIATDDPSVDLLHCTITVSRDSRGRLKYVLKDGPSNTGTFVDNEILGDRERRVIEDGQLFTIGATSIILHAPEEESR